MPQGRRPVRLADVGAGQDSAFAYEQPDISVDHQARTVNHELIGSDPSVVIQHMGRRPPEINVIGVCYRSEANAIDDLTTATGEPESLRSERYSGDVVVVQTETDPRREKDAATGRWLYDFRVNCIGLESDVEQQYIEGSA